MFTIDRRVGMLRWTPMQSKSRILDRRTKILAAMPRGVCRMASC